MAGSACADPLADFDGLGVLWCKMQSPYSLALNGRCNKGDTNKCDRTDAGSDDQKTPTAAKLAAPHSRTATNRKYETARNNIAAPTLPRIAVGTGRRRISEVERLTRHLRVPVLAFASPVQSG